MKRVRVNKNTEIDVSDITYLEYLRTKDFIQNMSMNHNTPDPDILHRAPDEFSGFRDYYLTEGYHATN